MENLFGKMFAASCGNSKAKWQVISYYKKEIEKVSEGNPDMENEIIMYLYSFLDTLNEKYIKFFESINSLK